MYYRRLNKGVQDKGILIPVTDDVRKYVDDVNDWYISLYEYNDEQYKTFKETRSVKGVEDVSTTRLLWDFDSKTNPGDAQKDALTLCEKLMEYGFQESDIAVFYSGSKGMHVEVQLEDRINVDQFKAITYSLASSLLTYDKTISDPARIVRVPGTKHQTSGLYKTELTANELIEYPISKIKEIATESYEPTVHTKAVLPAELKLLFNTPKVKSKVEPLELPIDFSAKMKGWSNCKWAILNGYQVKDGDRHTKLLTIIATCKALNVPKKKAYYLAKSAMKDGVDRYGGNECDKEDIWRDVDSVYDPGWKGGTFSCRDGKSPWLTTLCNSLGVHSCKGIEGDTVTTDNVFDLFKNYADNYEQNILHTGIDLLDQHCKFMVGTSNGILAPPGVGKTSLILSILNHNSNLGVNSVFFSYDMFHSMVYLRLIQKHFGYTQDAIFEIYKHNKKRLNEIKEKLSQEYKNVHFCFKSGQTADEIYETILDTEQKIGDKVKLFAIDYNELVNTNVTDPTQSSAIVAQRVRQISNDTESCGICLLQPAKIFSNPADEITTYQGAKGSGAIAQSLSLMLSLSRPGFSPRKPENDRFFTINALKHRQGSLFTLDLGWNGLTGHVSELSEEEQMELKQLREAKALEKSDADF